MSHSSKIISGIFLACMAGFLFSFISKDTPPALLVKQQFDWQSDSLFKSVQHLQQTIARYGKDTTRLAELQKSYIHCRLCFKRMEPLLEYYYPATSKALNGALVNESDEEEGTQTVIEPEGLQIIEDIIFGEKPYEQQKTIETHGKRVQAMVNRLPVLNKVLDLGDFQVMESLRLELIRIMALSITGFDAPASGNGLEEIKTELLGIKDILACYKPLFAQKDKGLYKKIEAQLNNSMQWLGKTKDLDALDRYAFVRDHIDPLYANIVKINKALDLTVIDLPSPISITAPSIFSNEGINTNYYISHATKSNAELVNLGRYLFFDPVLSGNNKRACSSCHNPQMAFTDNRDKSTAFGFEGTVARNAPTIINVGFQANYFYDSRANYLEEQIRMVTANQNELHGDLSQSAEILRRSEEYRTLFRKAFKGSTDTLISLNAIIKAISAYERSLVAMNSRFDRNIRRESTDFNSEEIAGFNLFMGKAQCGTCHFMPMFNGTVPPYFAKTEWEILGVPTRPDTANAQLDQDLGRFVANGMNLNKYAFKTTTLRNIALTAPYMHNGVYKNLEDVVDFYNRGGGAGIGIVLDTQTLPTEALGLNAQEKKAIVSFLKTLTDTTACTTAPSRLPVFNDPKLDQRKTGGEY